MCRPSKNVLRWGATWAPPTFTVTSHLPDFGHFVTFSTEDRKLMCWYSENSFAKPSK